MSINGNKALLAFAVILAGVYVIFFVHPYGRHTIMISPTLRPAAGQSYMSVNFVLDRDYHLTRVKVVDLDASGEPSTNVPLWSLVSVSNAAPVRAMFYGDRIAGMKSANLDQQPEPLTPGHKYRLFVEAGNFKGQTDFKTVAAR